MKSTVTATAPANIALIKYMGKSQTGNVPSNPSLSYTLNHLITTVQIEPAEHTSWRGLSDQTMALSESGQQKFLRHFEFLCQHWGIAGHYTVKSENNFPADCGLASSASSFAALTRATFELAKFKATKNTDDTLAGLSALSRRGSGSSCRSFFSPWAEWKDESAYAVDLPYKDLQHQVLVVSREKKTVSSSKAHQRILTSDLFKVRSERATARLATLKTALQNEDWNQAVELCWIEFWDMHALFETSRPPFYYMTPESLRCLRRLRSEHEKYSDGPLVTMDAGPNIHLLYRQDQTQLMKEMEGLFGELVL